MNEEAVKLSSNMVDRSEENGLICPRAKAGFAALLSLSTMLGAMIWIYGRRSRQRVPSHEGLNDAEISAAFNRVARWPQMRLLRRFELRRALDRVSKGTALDLGCGPGYLAIEMAHAAPNLRVIGVDLSPAMIAAGERLASEQGIASRTQFQLGDAARIPCEDASVDLVVSTLSLHHWQQPSQVLNEIARVLRPGGDYLIFDLRRDLSPPLYLLIWFVATFIVPPALRRAKEPLASRDASYTPEEARDLLRNSLLANGCVTTGPLWLILEGSIPHDAKSSGDSVTGTRPSFGVWGW